MFPKLKIYVPVLGLLLCTAFAMNTAAQGSAPSGNKVGIVNIQEAISVTNEGKKELDALQQRFGPRNNALKAQNDDVEKLKAQLQAQGDKLSETERGNRVKEITEKQKSLQRSAEDFQTEVQQAEQEIINRLGQKMLKVLEKYAEKSDYGIVLDVSNPQTPVLWARKGNNITKELVDAYNAENPVSGAPASKPAVTVRKPAATTPKPAAPATTPKKP